MKAQLIFIASLIVCLTLSQVVSTEKYRFFGDCEAHYDSHLGFHNHLTFICDRNTLLAEYCHFDSDCICRNNRCFCKSFFQVRKIDFANCYQPTILNETFRHFANANDLNMSHLGMANNQIGFLAELNGLTKIDASHNSIAAILNGEFNRNQHKLEINSKEINPN